MQGGSRKPPPPRPDSYESTVAVLLDLDEEDRRSALHNALTTSQPRSVGRIGRVLRLFQQLTPTGKIESEGVFSRYSHHGDVLQAIQMLRREYEAIEFPLLMNLPPKPTPEELAKYPDGREIFCSSHACFNRELLKAVLDNSPMISQSIPELLDEPDDDVIELTIVCLAEIQRAADAHLRGARQS